MPQAHHTAFSVDWLAHTFDLGCPYRVVRAGCGQTNPLAVLRLQTSRSCFAIKRLEHAPSRVALAIESAAYAAGFPMPQPLWTREGTPYATALHAGSSVWVRVYAWVDGTPYDWGCVQPQVSTDIGRLLAALHALAVPETQLTEESWQPLGWDGWEHLTTQAVAKGLSWAPTLRDTIPALVAWEDQVLAWTVRDEPVVPSQRDLHPPNILRGVDGSHVVVDWEAAGPVSAREEVAKFALVWATAPEQSPSREAVHAFIRGYREAGGHFASRGVVDLTHHVRTRLWWLAYNVRRDISARPGRDPDLTPALLAGIQRFDLETLKRTAALLDM